MTTQSLDRIRFVTRHFRELQGLRSLVPVGLITLSLGGTTYFDNWPFLALRAALCLTGIGLLLRSGRYYRGTFGEVEPRAARPAVAESLSIYSPAGPPQRLVSEPLLHPTVWRGLIVLTLSLTLVLALRTAGPLVGLSTDESLVRKPWLILYSGIDVSTFAGSTAGPFFAWQSWLTLRLQLMYLLYGSVFLGIWLRRGCRLSQSHHLILGVLLLGLATYGAALGYLGSVPWGYRIFDALLPVAAHLWVALLLCGSTMILAGLLDHWQIARALQPALEEVS
jgi:hypothetical protein